MIPGFTYDQHLVAEIAQRFDLREPNARAFHTVVEALANGYDPEVPLVLDLATGAGKTYIMAALIEYLREKGIHDVLIVTPSTVVQDKTVANFSEGDPKYIEGSLSSPFVVTPSDYDTWRPNGTMATVFSDSGDPVQLFILNVHQLTVPTDAEGETSGKTQDGVRRAFRKFRENSGNLHEYLREREDLVVIADEHHLYGETAQAFRAGIRDLSPAAVVGLTASASEEDHVIFRYPLKRAIQERYVKRPVLAFRRGGYGDEKEEQQLRDAVALLEVKQKHYEAYHRSAPDVPEVNAALFVQCADVAHATQVTALLRGPEFFGSESAVLQVDNQHDDVQTLQRLREMDLPHSPVRCVVSVNKLKEGWDVKNVAVMVTLRAMASEVLTQQTMGRGLRLPFGKWTGSAHVDQLDVLGHDSFRKFLSDEQVLKSFGLEDLTPEGVASPEPTPTPDPVSPDSGDRDQADTTPAAHRQDLTEQTQTPAPEDQSEVRELAGGAVGVVVIDDDAQVGADETPEPVIIRMNEQFEGETFTFPSTTMIRETSEFRLSRVEDDAIKNAARRIKDQGGVLAREVITFKGEQIVTREEEDVRVSSISIDSDQAKKDLIQSVMRLRVFDSSDPENLSVLENHIAPLLIAESGTTEWTQKLLASAVVQAREVIARAAREHVRGQGTRTVLHPHELPIATEYTLLPGRAVLDLLPADSKGEGFLRHQHYGPWAKGLFEAAAFDSFSAEYRIAAMLNRSGAIKWWKRLYSTDKATIAYTLAQDYNPDFVALDVDGYYWIIEGKAESGKDDQVVQAKRKAAEETIRLLSSHSSFDKQKWGYAIAYESDVKAADSWEDLLGSTNPVKTLG
ncbi:DEAD/DEAH box helicase [Kocuria rhizophila]|uniref:DEAD/DEAH box helicase n=1 Tax=Kocuria rhizophila TaxID=72000 RepID=UPI0022F128BB|nr:DEAD/DEAH box helicase family protein [Kocuria rhizophila]MDA4827486.1 DEAD/DEAH box helicase family protein [Kocuria rhizophila]